MDAFKILEDRGFLYQLTDAEALEDLLRTQKIRFYIGIDPTANSMHIGHLLPVMAARLLQQFGHVPIILIGGGTAMIGDPSGKTEMRQILAPEEIEINAKALKQQVARFIDFGDGRASSAPKGQENQRALLLDNIEWLRDVNYIEFLRDVGKHFSVNRMLAADSVKLRLESGLSFLEFNYMLLQAYDFQILSKTYGCELQIGGQDQWGNIVAGVDLIRRMTGKSVQGATFPLLTDRHGQKFGKTVKGAVWLDKSKTSVFDYYQFWRNVDDADVGKLLALYTNLPMHEVEQLGNLEDPDINRAKEILAYEATALAHGIEAAKDIYLAVTAQFGCCDPEGRIQTTSGIANIKMQQNRGNLPTLILNRHELDDGVWIVKLFVNAGLVNTNSAARRLIQSGGAYLNDQRVEEIDKKIRLSDFTDGQLLLRSGKKNIRRIVAR